MNVQDLILAFRISAEVNIVLEGNVPRSYL